MVVVEIDGHSVPVCQQYDKRTILLRRNRLEADTIFSAGRLSGIDELSGCVIPGPPVAIPSDYR